jgi:multicomponent Na+:H+ antiporter subunit D
MILPALLLIALSIAVGVVPGLSRGVHSAAKDFQDHQAYLAAVLHAVPLPRYPAEGHHWTLSGIVSGLVSGSLAILIALATLFREKLPDFLRAAGRPLSFLPMHALRHVHNGRVGDYAAWLLIGASTLAGLFALVLYFSR